MRAPVSEPVGTLLLISRVQIALARLASDWPALLAVEVLVSGAAGPGTRGEVFLPGGTARLDVIDAVPRLLHEWCGFLSRERGLLLSWRGGLTDVPALAWVLSSNAASLISAAAAHEVGLELSLVEELDTAAATVSGVLSDSSVRRIPVGPCPHLGCEGTVRAVLDPDAVTDPPLVCTDAAEHAWGPGDYLDAAAAMGREIPGRLPAPALADYLSAAHGGRVSVKQVEQWARFHPITFSRKRGGYDPVRVAAWYVGHRSTLTR